MSLHTETVNPNSSSSAVVTDRITSPTHLANNFDALRLAFAIAVILSHSWWVLDGSYVSDPVDWFTKGQTTLGTLSVAGFFLISGYLITGSWIRSKSVFQYISNRARRILPGYIVITILAAVIVAPLAGVDSFSTAKCVAWLKRAITFDATLDPGAFRNNPLPELINASLWTIRYEVLCYIAIPFVLLALKILPSWTIVIPTLVLSVLGGMHVHIRGLSHSGLYACFMAGATAYLFKEKIRSHWIAVTACLALLVVGARTDSLGFFLPAAGGYLVFVAAFVPGPLNRFGKYGDFSYGTYLYAFPLQQLLAQWWPRCSPLEMFVIVGIASVLLGALSWFIVERPFLKKRAVKPPSLPAQSDTVRPSA